MYPNPNYNKIDLHGLSRHDAANLVEDILLNDSNMGHVELKVITGNSSGMRQRIIEVCERWDFRYTIKGDNQGEIIITWEKL